MTLFRSTLARKIAIPGLLGAVLSLVLLSAGCGLIVKWLWMGQLGYEEIFWRLLTMKLVLFAGAFAVAFLYVGINLWWSIRNSRAAGGEKEAGPVQVPSEGIALAGTLSVAFVLSALFGLVLSSQWDTYLRFHWGGSFGRSDPIFHLDLGFYLFRLPFYELLQNALASLALFTLAGAFLIYAGFGLIRFSRKRFSAFHRAAGRHLSVLFLAFAAFWAAGYYLDRFQLLYSTRGVVYGAGYTDVNVVLAGLWVMIAASGGLGLFVLAELLRGRLNRIPFGIGGYFLLAVLALSLLPGVVQKFVVKPNELELETPYLRNNIEFTRMAYGLDRIEERDYPAVADLSLRQILDNRETLDNVRLWDYRPILQTFRQTQEIRLYYRFYEVDVDRYRLGGGEGYRQVMVSARELAEELPAKADTWVNRRLQYTHGYGVAMSFVSRKEDEGLPVFVVKDLPPVSPWLAVDRAAVYYGEKMPGFRVVNTSIREFDYPREDENVYVHYGGKGGVPLDSFWKRLLFAWTEFDASLLISSYVTPESRIQIWRRVHERVKEIAPFLRLDKDPYIVVSEGRLFWIQDAYTTSAGFPYSEPFFEFYTGTLNYIRNSVKVVVDAYEGSVRFYVFDTEDPILRAYREAFPGVFKDHRDMPQDLKAHVRYPLDLFAIQIDRYRSYHMTTPQVFYNQEDLWVIPREKYAGNTIDLEPYYILMRLPGERDLQYILMTPMNPQNRDNMIGWAAARCDFPDYGRILVFKLPKEKLIYGPLQIEAMIDQDDVISRQLSLWDQRGSRVIRGNLLVLPVDHAFLYVEPVYLIAEEVDIPQLKRVIAVYGNRVVMEPSLEDSIRAIFGPSAKEGTFPDARTARPAAGEDALRRAQEQLEQARKKLEDGEWKGFGEAMDKLREMLSAPRRPEPGRK